MAHMVYRDGWCIENACTMCGLSTPDPDCLCPACQEIEDEVIGCPACGRRSDDPGELCPICSEIRDDARRDDD